MDREENADVVLILISLQARCFSTAGVFQDFLFIFGFLQFEYDRPRCRLVGV